MFNLIAYFLLVVKWAGIWTTFDFKHQPNDRMDNVMTQIFSIQDDYTNKNKNFN